jgi:hypothetical protein
MLPEKQLNAFTDFYDVVRYNKILDQKTTIMLHMAAATALGCYP